MSEPDWKARAEKAEAALKWIAVFASVRATDPSPVFSKVARGALVTIAEKAKQAALSHLASSSDLSGDCDGRGTAVADSAAAGATRCAAGDGHSQSERAEP